MGDHPSKEGPLPPWFLRSIIEPRPPLPPPPPALLSQPWRTINWGENETVLKSVKNYRPQTEGQQLRILVVGPIGARKSSFINSVQSVLCGRMFTQALADNVSHSSFIKKYTTYEVHKEDGTSVYPFVFSDFMGLESKGGVLVDDIKLALRGHMKDGYKFNPESKLTVNDQFYNSHPTSLSKVQVLVLVVPADAIGRLDENMWRRLRKIRRDASSLEIPQVAILTKVDEFSELIEANVRNVYRVESLKKKMERFSADVGIPMNCIFPVKNYDSEDDLKGDVDSLILSALKDIIKCGDDCLNFKKSFEKLINFRTDDTVSGT